MPEYMTVPEAAQLLRINERSVYEWLRTGKLQAGRAGRRWLFTRQNLDDFVAGRGVYSADCAPAGAPGGRHDLAASVSPGPAVPASAAATGVSVVAPAARSNANPLASMHRNKNKRGR